MLERQLGLHSPLAPPASGFFSTSSGTCSPTCYDEYTVPELANVAFTGVADELNCSTNKPPHWNNTSLPANPALENTEGCALFGKGIFHPYHECLMGAHGDEFCHVCARELNKSLDTAQDADDLEPVEP